ncbi:hypothetical protein [Pseudoduganella sp. HUAS MS19]
MKDASAIVVNYDFPTPVTQVQFKQRQLETRISHWKLSNPDLLLDDIGLRSKSEQAFSHVSIEIPVLQAAKLRHYETTIPVGSSGAAILSEHLALSPETWSTSFRFNAGGVVRGRNIAPGTAWHDDLATAAIAGAYLYVGPLHAMQGERASFLFDPATPPWIKQEVKGTVDAVTQAYRTRFGVPKERIRPAIILSMLAKTGPSDSYRGDTLPGQSVRLALYGEEWAVRTEDRQRQLRRFLAHELAHIFNAELSRPANYGHAWIHEGMAEYAALNTLTELQLISRQYALDTMNASINNCQLGIASRSLLDIQATSPEQKLFYDCGVALFFTATTGSHAMAVRVSGTSLPPCAPRSSSRNIRPRHCSRSPTVDATCRPIGLSRP